jgi:hypothetical protein
VSQHGRAPRVLSWVLALCVVAAQVHAQGAKASLAGFFATDLFDDLRVRELPARAVVVATTPQTVFRYFETGAAERARPDLVLVPLPFLRYPGVAERAQRKTPTLSRLLAQYLEADQLDFEALRVLSRTRPVFVELDTTHVSPSAYASLAPAGMLYAVLAPSILARAFPMLSDARERRYARVQSELSGFVREVETKRQLLWLRYTDALHAAALGHRAAARSSLASAMALHPEDLHVQALAAALADKHATGPFDVTPFLRVDQPPAHDVR